MKKLFPLIVIFCVVFVMTGCVETKTLHCDRCNKEISVKQSSDMEEDWIIYCNACNEELFSDDPILGNK